MDAERLEAAVKGFAEETGRKLGKVGTAAAGGFNRQVNFPWYLRRA